MTTTRRYGGRWVYCCASGGNTAGSVRWNSPLQAEVSTRHLSFVETGRSRPSRMMVLRLAEHLDLPLRERNQLLLSAGYAPAYPETALHAPQLAAVRAAVRQVLAGHVPFPAAVVDRRWNLLDANSGIALFTAGVAGNCSRRRPMCCG